MGVAALDENLLYDELGVNAEYLIDHASGASDNHRRYSGLSPAGNLNYHRTGALERLCL